MTPWVRVTGTIKDKGSIWAAKFAPPTILRNPVLETAVIKATSHDERHIDYKNVERVMQWLAASPLHLKPLVFSLSLRMKKTRSWPVALKGLMLIHGIFCCDFPALQKIGRLPFDLSDFTDRHSKSDKVWGFNAFVRSYFTYLDQRSAFVSSEYQKRSKQRKEIEDTLMQELEKLQKMQTLIDTILQIRPLNERINNVALILEAMDCMVVELSDLYGKFCGEMSRILLRIYDMGGKMEASLGLRVVQKAAIQGEELACYFEFCREMGIVHAYRSPKVERISEENIRTLERMANGEDEKKMIEMEKKEEKGIVLPSKEGSETVITEKWEVFEDDNRGLNDGNNSIIASANSNPFLEESFYSLVPYNPPLPDLITF
ncbi:putative clathrin assembly protein At1g25240 [Prosopis cineraria]|uniref:putative clathrin assembly protein At1g25240 n=1 Tax=Prosopis cineraria TaxID=364024 RepID=UPI00240F9B41|nr:putative clathrin assembly protein At1g25240 [Prosopis cineraria]